MIASVLSDELPPNDVVFDEESPRHAHDVTHRNADEIALECREQPRSDHIRCEQTTQCRALQSERTVQGRSGIRYRSGFVVEASEEVLALLYCSHRDEQGARHSIDPPARTAQVANEFAAKRSTEMTEKDEQAHRTLELLAQSSPAQAHARDGKIEHGCGHRLVH